MKNEVQIGEYGIVRIIKGIFAGRFGYYDDDGIDDSSIDESLIDCEKNLKSKAIVYFGSLLNNSRYYYINYDCLTNNYTFDDLKKRKSDIESKFWKKISYQERCELMEEKILIDGEIQSRLENCIENKFISNKKVFLSHSSADKSTVISIASDLNERGISTWLDSFDILPGESIVSKINYGIKECDYMLLFLSNSSVKSSWVQKEWETFLWDEINCDKIKIIPIKLDDCEVPKLLQVKKYIDFSSDYNEGLFELIHTIRKYEKKD